jgi:hypothetical protein
MNEILLNILSVVVTAVILPLISYLGFRLSTYLNNKIKDEKARTLLNKANEIVTNAVRTVFQTYVEALKKEGNFSKESQLTALNKAKDIVLKELPNDVKEFIGNTIGNLNGWIENQIEATINILKN